MSAPIKPAMTAEEWAKFSAKRATNLIELRDSGWVDLLSDADETGRRGMWAIAFPDARHTLAAISLHDQPGGFRWADVDLLRTVEEVTMPHVPAGAHLIGHLADRIAALLPPREP